MNPECPRCKVPMALKYTRENKPIWYCPNAWTGFGGCTQVQFIKSDVNEVWIDPKLYGRTVRHTHVDSRDVGILRGVILPKNVDGYLLVEITSPKGKGSLVFWNLAESELE